MNHDHSHREHGKSQPKSNQPHRHADMAAEFQKKFWISLAISIPVIVLSPMFQKISGLKELRFFGDYYFLFFLSSIIFFYGGWPFLKGLANEIKSKKPGMMTLVGVAISTAYIYSGFVVFGFKGELFFAELATLIDIMLLGHWLEMKSTAGASRALEEMARLLPAAAHKIFPDGQVKDVPLEEIKAGDAVIVKPGEKIPTDGEVIEGETSVNESMVTGESTPVYKKIGSKVIGGSLNADGSITVKVTKIGSQSFLAQVLKLVKEAQQSKSKTQNLADRAAMWLTISAVTAGIVTLLLWLFFTGKDPAFAIERAVTVIVIACPHALGLAIPLVVVVSATLAAKNGLLIKNRAAFEKARNAQAIVFDKTGTLTEGKFGVTDVVVLAEGANEKEIIKYAASVEARSEHPIAKGIVAAAGDVWAAEEFKSVPGKGVEGKVAGKNVKIVSPGYLKENNFVINSEKIDALAGQGKTVVFVVVENQLIGAVALADVIRPESKTAVLTLKKMGLKCLMLTGDNKKTAKWVAEELGIDEFFAEVLPEEKVKKIREVKERGLVVVMVGDGVNDAPSLAQADVGIAIGAGTDVAIETGDIILVKNNPLDVVKIISLAKATYKKMTANLFWATGYNVFALPLAAGALYKFGILLSPAAGAVLMSLSTVIVAINARRLKI